METRSGWRATPAPLLLGLVVWLAFALVRLAMSFKDPSADFVLFVYRMRMIGEGVGFACGALLLLGTLEMLNRATPVERSRLKLAAIGVGVAFAADTALVLLQFTKDPWGHTTVMTVYYSVALVGWGLFVLGLTLVAPPSRRVLGFVAIGLTIVTWMPEQISNKLWHALSLEGKPLYVVEMLCTIVRLALLAALVTMLPHRETPARPHEAAEGMRSVARGLFIRVVLALVVALFVVMMSMSRGAGEGALSFFKLLMMTQVIVGVVALAMTGFGALRAARSGVRDLGTYSLTIGGGASLWATGVSLVQVPMIYRMFYGDRSGFNGREMREMTEVLSTALPVVVIVGVGVLATVIAGWAARRGNEDLRSDAQGKGIGYMVLTLAAIAIATWMLPKARKAESGAMLMLLAAGASLWGTVMIAKLFQRAADAFEADPGLPPATLVNDPPA